MSLIPNCSFVPFRVRECYCAPFGTLLFCGEVVFENTRSSADYYIAQKSNGVSEHIEKISSNKQMILSLLIIQNLRHILGNDISHLQILRSDGV